MSVTYFKRYRMEIYLKNLFQFETDIPNGYELVPWHPELLDSHAEAKFDSFQGEVDSHVFPCLGESNGCQRLMHEIANKSGFLDQATWLLTYRQDYSNEIVNCGTVQGIVDREGVGGIQNLGIVPEHRDQGLGSRLLFQALHGFRSVGLRKACLEVTAQNSRAVKLYRRLGFRKTKTVYKAVEVALT